MTELSGLFELQFLMLVDLGIGYFACKMKLAKAEEREVLAKLVVYFFLPCNIVSSFEIEQNPDLLNKMLMIFVISCLIQLSCSIINRLCYQQSNQVRKPVLQYATACSNAGFMGNAVAEGIYGQLGLMLAQIYLVPARIIMWSAGVAYFEGGKGNTIKTIQKVMTHPCVIAVMIGLIRLLLNIRFPFAVEQTMTSLGRCATPLIMIYIGMIIAETGFRKLLNRETIRYAVFRLLVIPGVALVIVKTLQADVVTSGISVLLAAMPAGTTTAVLAGQYQADEELAADIIVLTTLMSIIVLPLWVIMVNSAM